MPTPPSPPPPLCISLPLLTPDRSLPSLRIAAICCENNPDAYFTYNTEDLARGPKIGPVVELLHSHFVDSLNGPQTIAIDDATPPISNFSSITFTLYDATAFQFPPNLDEHDGFLIPGSLSSSYSDVPWVVKLRVELGSLHKARKKTIGICFGHQVRRRTDGVKDGWNISHTQILISFCSSFHSSQIYAHANGGESMRNPLGPTLYQVTAKATEKGRSVLGEECGREEYSFLSSHSDIVSKPGTEGAALMTSERCENQVVGYSFSGEQYAFTIQSHPEYCCEGEKVIDSVAVLLEEEVSLDEEQGDSLSYI